MKMSRAAGIVGLAAVYYAAAEVALLAVPAQGDAAAIRPASGVGLVALLLLGNRLWPGIAIGAMAAAVTSGAPLLAAGGVAMGVTLEALLAATLLRRAGFRHSLERLRDAWALLLAGALAAAAGAAIAVAALCTAGAAPWVASGTLWLTRWLGHGIGILIAGPVLLTWFSRPSLPGPRSRTAAEGVALMLAVCVVGGALFGGVIGRGARAAYFVTPLMVWAALRFNQRGAMTAMGVVTAFAVWGTATGSGPFAVRDWNRGVMLLQGFAGMGGALTLIGTAIIAERRHALREVASQARLLQSVLDNTAAAVMAVDPNGRYTVFNAAARRLFRRTDPRGTPHDPDRQYGLYFPDMTTPFPLEKVPLTRVLRGADRAEEAALFFRSDEVPEGAWVSVRAAALRDAAGDLQGAVLLVDDISARKRVEDEINRLNRELDTRVRERTAQLQATNRRLEQEILERQRVADALQATQRQLQDIMDNSTAVVHTKDIEGRYVLVNRRHEEYFGRSKAEIVGKTPRDLYPAETADALLENDRQVIVTRRPMQFEEVVRSKEGLATYLSVKFPLFDGAGNLYGVCGISTDITERKRLEGQLKESEARLSALIENTDDMVWAVDRRGDMIVANAAARRWIEAAAGTARSDAGERVSAEFFRGLVPEDTWRYWMDLYERALGGNRFAVEYVPQDYGLGRPVLLVSLSPIMGEDGPTGATVFAKDITALRRAQEESRHHLGELAHVQRVSSLGAIAAGLAHEINQPLGAIANFAQGCERRIKSGAVEPKDILHAVEQIAGEALRAGKIIRRLRGLVRKEQEGKETNDVNQVVLDALQVAEPEARRRGISMRTWLAPELPRALCDAIQIEQVVLNLLLNGMDAMEETPGKELIVETALQDGNEIEIAVRDTGVGIDRELAERMFDPFVTTKSGGLGMGLAISHSIVQAHGGRLWATPNGDCGTTFRLRLPLVPEEAGLPQADVPQLARLTKAE